MKLSKGDVELELPAPSKISPVRVGLFQGRGRTAGGVVFAYGLGEASYEVEIEFDSLGSSEKEGLVSFFEETACGVRESWTYTDELDQEYTARFVLPEVEITLEGDDLWRAKMPIELDRPLE